MLDPNRPEIIPSYIVIGDDSFEDLGLTPEEIALLKATCDDEVFAEICGFEDGGFEEDIDDPDDDPDDDFLDDF